MPNSQQLTMTWQQKKNKQTKNVIYLRINNFTNIQIYMYSYLTYAY